MKKLVLSALLCINVVCGYENNPKYFDLQHHIVIFQRLGVAYCANMPLQHQTLETLKNIQDIFVFGSNSNGNGLFNNIIVKQIFSEIQKLFISYHYDRTNINAITIMQCLEIYDSKEYQDEVERIVKKYCKNCK